MKTEHTIVLLAFNSHKLTMNVLNDTYKNNPESNFLFFDNGSTPSYEKLIDNLNIDYHRENNNIYVNPAWNKIFDMVTTPYVTILNNDCFIVSKNYFSTVIPHMKKNGIMISSCKTKNRKSLKLINLHLFRTIYNIFSSDKINFNQNAMRQGWLMTINLYEYKKLNYKIPSYIKVWFGDDWIWGQAKSNNKITGVYNNKLAIHIRYSTTKSKAIKTIIDQDIEAIKKYGKWYQSYIKLIH